MNRKNFLGAIHAWLAWPRAIVISLVVAFFVTTYVYLFTPLQYSASATVLVSQYPDVMQSIGMVSAGDDAGMAARLLPTKGRNSIARFEAILKSRTVISNVAENFDIASRMDLNPIQTYKRLRGATTLRTLGNFTNQFGLAVKVTWAGRSRVASWFDLPADYSNKEARQLSAELANSYVRELDDYITQTTASQAKATTEFIRKRLDETESELSDVENRLAELQSRHGFIEPDQKVRRVSQEIGVAAEEYARAKALVQETQNALQSAMSHLEETEQTRIVSEIEARNPVVTQLEQRKAQLQVELNEKLEGGLTRSHPDVIELQAQINSAEEQLSEITQEIIEQTSREANPIHDLLIQKIITTEMELAGAEARQTIFRQIMDAQQAQLSSLPSVTQNYVDLSRRQKTLSQLTSNLRMRLETATIEQKRVESGELDLLDEAHVPLKKSAPSATKTAAVTFIIAFVLQGLLIAWRDDLLGLARADQK